jgi:hypothetical protein
MINARLIMSAIRIVDDVTQKRIAVIMKTGMVKRNEHSSASQEKPTAILWRGNQI